MRRYRAKAHCGLELMGFDFYATIDFVYTPGRPETWCKRIGTWNPPDPPEIEIDNIWLEVDEPGKDAPRWRLTGQQLYLIAEHEAVTQACWESSDLEDVE